MKRLLLVAVGLVFVIGASAQQEAVIEHNPIDNTVSTIKFEEGAVTNDLKSIINEHLQLSRGYSWQEKFDNKSKDGISISRQQLFYNGYVVEHGSISAISKNGQVSFVNANLFKAPFATTAKLTEQQALDVALNNINAKVYGWQVNSSSKLVAGNPVFSYPKGELVWVEDFSKEVTDRQLHLAYKFDIYAEEPLSRDKIYIDATTGKVLLKDPVIKHVSATGQSVYSGTVNFEVEQKSPSNYEMNDLVKDVYTYTLNGGTNFGSAVSVSNNSTTFSKSVAVDAHWGATVVYDYWKTKHNRDSYDDLGSDLSSVVNYSNNYNNAFWSGFAMVYGNGSGMFQSGFDALVALDVCAHEIGHGVCEYTSNLVYAKESGAMNEGFSDIWGAVIEHYGDSTKQMWSIGEELGINSLRSMKDPKRAGDPDTHDGFNWVQVVGCSPNGGNDNCGVHTNSGVLNYWFYLLVEGGKGTNDKTNQYEVAGLGVDKAAEIAYATEQALTSTATYMECRNVSINYAATKYGQCSREVEAVTRAWYAVGVGNAFAPCAPQVGFEDNKLTVSKVIAGTNCPASKQIQIALRITGNAPIGGNATVQVMGAGSAVNGVDYSLPTTPVTFNAGSTASQNVFVTIYDNGDVTKDKQLKLYTVITQNGSNMIQSYTYDTCVINIVGVIKEPDTGGAVTVQVGRADIKSKAITPFFSRNKVGKNQFIITAEELEMAGVNPNEPIQGIEFYVAEKNSTQAFNSFTLRIESTAFNDLTSGNITTVTQYYNGNYTTQLGWNRLPFSSNLTWNGTDNLVIETCFSNGAAGNGNDYIWGVGKDAIITSFRGSNGNNNGCTMSFTGGHSNYSRPVVRFVQTVAASEAEQVVSQSRQWDVKQQHDVFFKSTANNKLIARINNPSVEMGCTDAAVTKQGAGMVPLGAPFPMANRSVKEFSVTATSNTGVAGYDLTLFFDTSELSVTQLGNEQLVATTAAHDSLMDTSNTKIITPVAAGTSNYYGFKGSFTGVSTRYFLIDRSITLPEPESVNDVYGNQNFKVVNNPFTNALYLSYNIQQATTARIMLYDIAGKQVYSSERQLNQLDGKIRLDVGQQLSAGTYFLQIHTAEEAGSYIVIKQ